MADYLPLGLFLLLFAVLVSLSSGPCWQLSELATIVGMGMSPKVHEKGEVQEAVRQLTDMNVILMILCPELEIMAAKPVSPELFKSQYRRGTQGERQGNSDLKRHQ